MRYGEEVFAELVLQSSCPLSNSFTNIWFAGRILRGARAERLVRDQEGRRESGAMGSGGRGPELVEAAKVWRASSTTSESRNGSQCMHLSEIRRVILSTFLIQMVIRSNWLAAANSSLRRAWRTMGKEDFAVPTKHLRTSSLRCNNATIPLRTSASSSQEARSLRLVLDCWSSSSAGLVDSESMGVERPSARVDDLYSLNVLSE